ncbi:hypothetical protein CC1G_10936 [Coprinopsis cinerea okayama7|uniref:Uncharacterized protein n=1 Tax=Coprinopsis cinerea (strain Okayama-7 / 130 / ATCC MYA-4618 / FGSC 9003) TaxID=240176 RepID=A8NT46_COPC7|nr:hypothetical protein CC1G_10936 [Coprinopsis cinerea okayama7\|eukprot:XP_001836155.1 hypothetical protein CC1G_10936 [Coprinopsis cinerea okayama7\
MGDYIQRLTRLKTELESFQRGVEDRLNAEEELDQIQKEYTQILCRIVAVVDEAEASNADNLEQVVMTTDDILEFAVGFAYEDFEALAGDMLFEEMASFAHSEQRPVLGEEGFNARNVLGQGKLDLMLQFMVQMGLVPSQREIKLPPGFEPPKSWKATPRPHTLSTPCARFSDNLGPIDFPLDKTRALCVLQARCEVTNDETPESGSSTMASDGKGFVVRMAGGWKNRDPLVYFRSFDDAFQQADGMIEPGLCSLVDDVAFNHERFIVAAADDDRIKTYTRSQTGTSGNVKMLPLHTINTREFTGPLAFFSNNRLVRCGKGKLGVWNLDELATHGPSGKKIIGKQMDPEDIDTWRDFYDDEIELSTGTSKPSTTLPLSVDYSISEWHPYPSRDGVMLCASDSRASDERKFRCHALDIEHGGQIVTRYLGIGGEAHSFSTSKGDPDLFSVCASDGYTRLFDPRHPLPVMTIKSSVESSSCAALCHPDGVPLLFVGGGKEECIKLWDLRSRTPVYELATGNNAVMGLAWDDQHDQLFAITSCSYMDRMGERYGYRRAKIPKGFRETGNTTLASVEDEDMEDDDDDLEDDNSDDDFYDYDEYRWPKDAHHSEDYFGHIFDLGSHNILRYQFKHDADKSIVPQWNI